jgi:hypothetical protein
MSDATLNFSFDFGNANRTDLLAEAQQTISGLKLNLDSTQAVTDAPMKLLEELKSEVANFGVYPEVLPLEARHFSAHGLKVPARFTDLSAGHRFYWLRLPLALHPRAGLPFYKLECAVEFNPDETAGHLRPRAQLILPDRKFRELMTAQQGLSLQIGENFEFEVKTPAVGIGANPTPGPVVSPTGSIAAEGAVEAKVAGQLGFVAGPFNYRLRQAQIEHTEPDLEKIFWRLTGGEFFEEETPTLIVVLKVPREVRAVKIAAALQAYHHLTLAAPVWDALAYAGDRIVNFFRRGAPKPDTATWDITPSLG